MDQEITEARREVARARAQVAGSIAAIDHRVTDARAAATRAVNPMEHVRANPLVALALAAGVGAALAASGSDRKASEAAKRAALAAPDAAKDAAGAAADAARRLVHGNDAPDGGAVTGGESPTLYARLVRGVFAAVDARLAALAVDIIRKTANPS